MRFGKVIAGRAGRRNFSLPSPSPEGDSPGTGLFAGGYSGGQLAVTDKYTFASDGRVAGTNLSAADDAMGGTGNTTRAIFSGYNRSHRYIYATNASTAATALPGFTSGYAAIACGNETRGIFTRSFAPTVTSKYIYADDTSVYATSLPQATLGNSAVGTSAFSIWGGGNGSVLSSKYTYSNDTTAVATSLTNAHYEGSAAGNTSIGVFFSGISHYDGETPVLTNSTTKYAYGTNTVTTGNTLQIRVQGAACGNSTRAIFGAGIAEFIFYTKRSDTQKYTFADDVVTVGTNLGTARYDLAAASSAPGGFA